MALTSPPSPSPCYNITEKLIPSTHSSTQILPRNITHRKPQQNKVASRNYASRSLPHWTFRSGAGAATHNEQASCQPLRWKAPFLFPLVVQVASVTTPATAFLPGDSETTAKMSLFFCKYPFRLIGIFQPSPSTLAGDLDIICPIKSKFLGNL